jgi:hypothetical protein
LIFEKSIYKKARVSYNTPFSFSGEGLRLALAQALGSVTIHMIVRLENLAHVA